MQVTIEEDLLPANAETLRIYYESVEKGNFLDIMDTLAEEITYVISGRPSVLPFSGVWSGKKKVTELFQAFGAAFQLLNLKENLVINSSRRVISCNDESFAVFKTGIFYRVPVLHIAEFNDENRIVKFTNIHDTSTAEQAFSGDDPALVPIMPISPLVVAKTAFSHEIVKGLAQSLVDCIFVGQPMSKSNQVSTFHLYIPGLPHRDLISGVWTGTLLEHEYPKRLAKFKIDRNLQKGVAQIDRVTLSDGQLAIEGNLIGRDNPWCIAAHLNNKSFSAASLHIDFEAL